MVGRWGCRYSVAAQVTSWFVGVWWSLVWSVWLDVCDLKEKYRVAVVRHDCTVSERRLVYGYFSKRYSISGLWKYIVLLWENIMRSKCRSLILCDTNECYSPVLSVRSSRRLCTFETALGAVFYRLAEYKASLHKQCDFVLKNFETRQTARSEEIEALAQAKQILSGAQ